MRKDWPVNLGISSRAGIARGTTDFHETRWHGALLGQAYRHSQPDSEAHFRGPLFSEFPAISLRVKKAGQARVWSTNESSFGKHREETEILATSSKLEWSHIQKKPDPVDDRVLWQVMADL